MISITAVSNLDFIISEPPHCFDRVLQKSMIGRLHQWLVDQQTQFLMKEDKDNEAFSYDSMFKTT